MMRFTLLLGQAPRDAARVRAAERAALAAAEAAIRAWEGAVAAEDPEGADEALEALRARLRELDRAHAEAAWAGRRRARSSTS